MSSRQLRVGLLNFWAWRFEVFDQAAGGWKIILHPAPGSSGSPQTMITDHANGLGELLRKAKTSAMTGNKSAGLKASN
ncbi:MAG: hypothetical protein ING24_11350 [Roseomonas sp.]|nr:hypothetical protein [Roseomonas sp.]MCA3343022.1 hypothetical protein [Roseomonas sp.]